MRRIKLFSMPLLVALLLSSCVPIAAPITAIPSATVPPVVVIPTHPNQPTHHACPDPNALYYCRNRHASGRHGYPAANPNPASGSHGHTGFTRRYLSSQCIRLQQSRVHKRYELSEWFGCGDHAGIHQDLADCQPGHLHLVGQLPDCDGAERPGYRAADV